MTILTSELILKLKDEVSSGAKGISTALEAVAASEKAVGRNSPEMKKMADALAKAVAEAKKIESFRQMSKALDAASINFKAATQNLNRLKSEMAAAEKPTRALQNAVKAAQAEAKAAKTAFIEQGQAVRSARQEFEAAGTSIKSLAKQEAELRASIEGTTKAMTAQAMAENKRSRTRATLSHAGNMALMYGGPAMMAGAGSMFHAGSEIQTELVRMRAAGLSPGEINTALIQSQDLQLAFTNVKREAILELSKELRSVLLHPEEVPHMLPTVVNAKSAMDALDSSGELSSGLTFAVKGAELLGLAQNPERFAAYLDSFVKAQQVMGKTITPEQQYEFAKYSKASGAALSDRFKMTTGVSLAQDLGGSTTGVAVNQFIKQITGGFQGNLHAAAKEFVALGLANEDDFEKTKTGEIKGLLPGRSIPGSKLAMTDPDQYVYQYLLPALERAGITDQQDQISRVRRLFPNSNAADLVTKLITQRESFQNHAKLYGEAQGLSATANNQQDAAVALNSLGTAIHNFAGTLTAPIMSDVASTLSSWATGIASAGKSLGEFTAAHPDLAKWLGGAAVGGLATAGGVGTYNLLDGLTSGFGLKTSALALDQSAVALTRAAVALGGAGAAEGVGAGMLGLGAAGAGGFLGRIMGGAKWLAGRAGLPMLIGSLLWDAPHPKALDQTPGEAIQKWAWNSAKGSPKYSPALQDRLDDYLSTGGLRQLGMMDDNEMSRRNGAARLSRTTANPGIQLGGSIADGVKSQQPAVESAAQSILDSIKAMFSGGVDVPVRLNSGGDAALRGIHADVGIGHN